MQKESIEKDLELEVALDQDNSQDEFAEMIIDRPLESVVEEKEEQHEIGDIVVGLDIGTTKICCVVGELFKNDIDVLGVGIVPSSGLRKGVIVNIESTVESIIKAVELASEASGYELKNVPVYVGIAGSHIKGFNSPGIVAINNREIKKADLLAVRQAAQTVKISENQKIIHVLPQEYMVDDHVGIPNPIGMTGVRLATNVHIVTADIGAIHNLTICCEKAGLQVQKIVLESIASSNAVLTKEEKDNGVALIDIGGGTTDLAVFREGTVRHTIELGLGGHNLTNDISLGLRTPLHEAECLKESYGGAIASIIKPNYVVEVPSVGDRDSRKIPQKVLVDILEARIKEILEMMDQALVSSGQKSAISHGIVLTGGTALLPNIVDLAEQIFDLPVRVGFPDGIKGKVDDVYSPRCATGVGLVCYGRDDFQDKNLEEDTVIGKICRFFKNIM